MRLIRHAANGAAPGMPLHQAGSPHPLGAHARTAVAFLTGSSVARSALVAWLRSVVWLALPIACAPPAPRDAPPDTGFRASAPPSRARFAAEAPSTAPTQAEPEPGSAVASLRRLAVPGFEPALLFIPGGAAPRPLVLAAHGAGGGPAWECEYWRRLTRERAFVLCLSGTPLGGSYSGYYFRDHRALEREWVAAEQAARAAEPRILGSSGIYAGFSQGATMGTAILAHHAAAFPYGVLIEGFMPWNVPGARQFVRAGGRRLLFACGSKECAAVAKTSVHWCEAARAEARWEYAPRAGHTPAGLVMEQIASALPWLVEGDPRWRAGD